MTIYFLRHASAGERKPDPEKDDRRALDKDGIQQCTSVGRTLAAMDIHVDVIVTSPLKRAMQTASLVANEIAYEGKLEVDNGLRPEATYAGFRELLQRFAEQEAIMVVGHNPNLSAFLGRVISRGTQPADIDLKKGGIAKVDFAQRTGTLEWYLTPKIVRSVYSAATESSRPKTSRK